MPSAFIAATASPRALNCWAHSTWRGSSRVASSTESTSSGVRRGLAVEQLERGQGERRQRLVEREVGLQVDGRAAPCGRRRRARSSRSTTPGGEQRRGRSAIARRTCRRCAARGPRGCPSAGGASRRTASPGRAITLSTIAWVTPKLRRQRLGLGARPAARRSARAQATKPSGGFLRTTLRRFFGSSPALASACSFSIDVLGRLHDDRARRCRSPARPARPAIWWNSRALQQPRAGCRRTWTAPVNSTVRIGTLMPDAEGVGAADDLEQPGLGELLDEPAVLRQHARRGARRCRGAPAGDSVLPKPGGEPEAADQRRRSRPSPRGCTR